MLDMPVVKTFEIWKIHNCCIDFFTSFCRIIMHHYHFTHSESMSNIIGWHITLDWFNSFKGIVLVSFNNVKKEKIETIGYDAMMRGVAHSF